MFGRYQRAAAALGQLPCAYVMPPGDRYLLRRAMKLRVMVSMLAAAGLLATAFAVGGPSANGAGMSLASAVTKTISPKEKARVLAWVTAHESVFSKLENGFLSASTAANKDKVAALHADCANLKKVITGAQAIAPIPDPPIEAVFKSSLANLMLGTVDCISGTSTNGSLKPALLNAASKYWETGGNQLIKVGQELDSVAG